jgi:hypothetical protein
MAVHVVAVTPGDLYPVEGDCTTCQFDSLVGMTFYTLGENGPRVFAEWVGCGRCGVA